MLRKYENGLVKILLIAVFAALYLIVLAPANRYELVVDLALFCVATQAWLLVSIGHRWLRKPHGIASPFPGSTRDSTMEESLATLAR